MLCWFIASSQLPCLSAAGMPSTSEDIVIGHSSFTWKCDEAIYRLSISSSFHLFVPTYPFSQASGEVRLLQPPYLYSFPAQTTRSRVETPQFCNWLPKSLALPRHKAITSLLDRVPTYSSATDSKVYNVYSCGERPNLQSHRQDGFRQQCGCPHHSRRRRGSSIRRLT